MGVPLGNGVFGIVAYIPKKGFVHFSKLTQQEIKNLKTNKL